MTSVEEFDYYVDTADQRELARLRRIHEATGYIGRLATLGFFDEKALELETLPYPSVQTIHNLGSAAYLNAREHEMYAVAQTAIDLKKAPLGYGYAPHVTDFELVA